MADLKLFGINYKTTRTKAKTTKTTTIPRNVVVTKTTAKNTTFMKSKNNENVFTFFLT